MCASTHGSFCLFRSCPRCRSIPSFRRSVCRALPGVLLLCGGVTLRLAGAWRLTRQSRGGPRPALLPPGGAPAPSRVPRSLRSRPALRPGFGESGRGQARVLFYRLRAAFRTASAPFRHPTNCALFPLVTHRSSDTSITHPPSI